MRLLRFTLFFSLIFAAALVRGQSVRWEPGDPAFGNSVQLVFEDCEPEGDPQLPTIANATLTLAGRSTSVNMTNASVTRTVVLSYVIQSRRGGALQIPPFTVRTNKGQLRVAAFNGAAPTITADSVATSKLLPERPSVWAGEVFGLTYRISAAQRNNPRFDPSFAFDWNPAPLVTEEWGKPTVNEAVVDGQRQIVISTATRAYAKAPKTVQLEAAHQVVNVQTGAVGFGFFTQPRMEPVAITSDQPVLEVRPLPSAPPAFTGAVGQFKLTSKVVPTEVAVGEPITWTLELTGTGNWPDIAGLPSRDVSKDFNVVQPKAKRTPAEGKLFEMTLTEDVVLVPTKGGTYALGPVAFTFFNPKTGAYETVRTERVTIKISAPTTPAATAGATNAQESRDSNGGAGPGSRPVSGPASPGGIPRDPLPGQGDASLPLSTGALVIALLTPIGALIVFWLVLAAIRAAKTDPLRARREARAHIALLLPEIRQLAAAPQAGSRVAVESTGAVATAPVLTPLAVRLLQWQKDSAILFDVSQAAPNAAVFEQPLTARGTSSGSDAQAGEWARLWREADRVLYGPKPELPSDWVARAEAALAAKRVAAFNPIRLFLPQNLLVFAAAIALACLVGLSPSTAQAAPTPDTAYRAGDFAAAEAGWRAAVAAEPTDWIARHNLSLALTQQDRVGEAAAHAVGAFVQHPGDRAVRWNFLMTAQKAGFAPNVLLPFTKDGPASSIAGLASPAQWQRLLILAAFLVAGALGWLLFNAYGRRSRLQGWIALAACGLAALLGVVSIFGVVAYGEIADRRAVVTWQTSTLRSIPTEADTTQKTTVLPAGSLAIVDKTFLGWNRLVFANGQTGWVRKEETVALWR